MLIVVLVVDQVRGTRRWIDIGFFQFQPSELGKVLLILVLAGFVAERARHIGEWRTTLGAVGLTAVPAVLVFIEPDFGTALVYIAIVGGGALHHRHALVAPRRARRGGRRAARRRSSGCFRRPGSTCSSRTRWSA